MTRRARAIGILAAAAALACAAGCVTHEKRANPSAPEPWRLRVGPFFEWHDRPDGGTLRAVRPFWSRETDPAMHTDEQDFLWPAAVRHMQSGNMWWRVLNAWGVANAADPEYTFWFFPLWHHGRDRKGDFSCGLFPVYGRAPHILFMDNVEYALFPLYLGYDVNGVSRHYALWPVISCVPERGSFGFWPLAGRARQRESTHWYALWPVATWALHDADRDTSGEGCSWMFWPLCGGVSRERESQWMFLPPLFGYAETPYARRWRAPWPLFERFNGTYKDSWMFWPFYTSSDLYRIDAKRTLADAAEKPRPEPQSETRHYIWWLVTDETTRSDKSRTESFRVFPFWTSEKTYRKNPDGTETVASSYRRFWPFWSSETKNGKNVQRALELCPVRHAPGIDRNWAPFWTLWGKEETPDGETVHTWLWGLIEYTLGGD